jgi:hypothetical protein
MHCPLQLERSAELIVGYGAKTLDRELALEFERHIERCADCRREAVLQRAVWLALDECLVLIPAWRFDSATRTANGRAPIRLRMRAIPLR